MSQKFFLFKYQEEDIVVMRKPHPCGSKEWIVRRIGQECTLECLGCNRRMSLIRASLEKSTDYVMRQGEKISSSKE